MNRILKLGLLSVIVGALSRAYRIGYSVSTGYRYGSII